MSVETFRCVEIHSVFASPPSLSLLIRLSSVSMSVNFRECLLIVSVLCKFFNDDFLHEWYQTAGPIFASRQRDKCSLVLAISSLYTCKNEVDLHQF